MNFHYTPPKEDSRYWASLADAFYKRIEESIKDAEEELSEDEVLLLYYYGQGGEPILVDSIGYHNTNLIRLYGFDAQNNECTVLVHMQALQLVLKVVKERNLQDKNAGRQKIGFTGEVAPRSGTVSSSDEDDV